MSKAICEDCGSLVEAELTHNGVCQVGHYVHCGWGHELSPDDLISDAAAIEILTEQLEATRADAKEAEAYAEELEKRVAFVEGERRKTFQALLKVTKIHDEVEAKLAKAVRGLNAICVWGEDTYARDMARTTLAEIEGEKG
jgi:hypothetical protein